MNVKIRSMKTKTTLGLMMAIGLMQAVAAQADDVYVLSWRGTLYYTNDAGRIVAKSYTERDVINRIALNTGASASQLVLVYRPLSLDTAVVLKSDPNQWVGLCANYRIQRRVRILM